MAYSKEMAHKAAFTVNMGMVWVILKPYSLPQEGITRRLMGS